MITHSDEGPDFDPEDELTVLLCPPTEYLGPPPGRYEAIRRGATRRRVLRATVGAALTCGVAALVILPLRLTATDAPGTPAVPMAPPPASSPSTPPSRTPTPEPSSPRRTPTTPAARTVAPDEPPTATARTSPSTDPSARTATQAPSVRPSADRSEIAATPSSTASSATGF